MFFDLIKLLFSGFLPFKGNFVCGQNNSKYHDWVTLKRERDNTRSPVAEEYEYKMDAPAREVMFKIGKGEFSCYNFPFVKEKSWCCNTELSEFVVLQVISSTLKKP